MTTEAPVTRPAWTQTVVPVLGLVLGLAPALATFVYQEGQSRREDRRLCIEQYKEVMQLAGQVREGGLDDLAAADSKVRQLDVMRDFVVETCRQAGLTSAAKTLDAKTETAAAPPAVVAPAPPPKAGATPGLGAGTGVKPQIFIQIGNERDRDAARRLQAALAAKGYVAPGVELVANSPSTSSLRCFKKADCSLAPALAGLVNGLLAQPQVSVADFSGRYETSPTIRPGQYELWFSPSAQLSLKP